MSDRIDRLNELRKARGLKPVPMTVDKVFDATFETVKEEEKVVVEEKSLFEKAIEIEKSSSKLTKKKPTKKKEVVVETTEEANTDNLFETDSEPLNKEEKVEENSKEETLNEG